MVVVNNMLRVTGKFIRKGASIARGTTIDAYLSETDCEKLYSRWDDSWERPYEFRGGIKAITCEMVLSVPLDVFCAVMGKTAGQRIYDIAKINAGR